jgi:hypothetical protein
MGGNEHFDNRTAGGAVVHASRDSTAVSSDQDPARPAGRGTTRTPPGPLAAGTTTARSPYVSAESGQAQAPSLSQTPISGGIPRLLICDGLSVGAFKT